MFCEMVCSFLPGPRMVSAEIVKWIETAVTP